MTEVVLAFCFLRSINHSLFYPEWQQVLFCGVGTCNQINFNMKTATKLTNCLLEAGIRPSSFAYFLSEYVRKKPVHKKSVLSVLLSAQLREQAELIIYNLNH